jgi:hypothetical protein
MYYALWGHNPGNLIAEFDDEAEALVIVRELLEDGWDANDLSLGPPPGPLGGNGSVQPPVLTGPALAARARAAVASSDSVHS